MHMKNRVSGRSTSATALITGAVVLLLSATPANAQSAEKESPPRPLYVQFDVGFSPKGQSRLEGIPSGRLDYDGSIFPASLTIGWKPAALQNEAGGLAIELSSYQNNLAIRRLTIGPAKSPSDGKLKLSGIMVNLRYEAAIGAIRPYLIGGVGFACPELKDVPQLKLRDGKLEKVSFAGHVGAGVGFQPKVFGRASLWLGYDLLAIKAPRFKTQFGINPPSTMRVEHVLPQTVKVGVRFAF